MVLVFWGAVWTMHASSINTLGSECADGCFEFAAAVLVVLEEVEGGAGRGEQNDIAFLGLLISGLHCLGRIVRVHDEGYQVREGGM